jgi:hypothetical protein
MQMTVRRETALGPSLFKEIFRPARRLRLAISLGLLQYLT